jgi:hypothetical protein
VNTTKHTLSRRLFAQGFGATSLSALLVGLNGSAAFAAPIDGFAAQAEWEQKYDADAALQVKRTVTPLLSQQTVAMTEAAIKTQWNHDLFVAMGEDVGKGAWSLRMQVRPLIQFVWFGAIIMMFGGIIAGLDRRYRQPKTVTDTSATQTSQTAQARPA